MTPEEAAELILKGDAWKPCLECVNGRILANTVEGYQAYDAQLGVSRPARRTRMCGTCQGTTLALRAEYMEACQVLGKPLPARPTRPRNPFFDEIDRQPLRPERYIMHKETWHELIDLHATLPIQKKDSNDP